MAETCAKKGDVSEGLNKKLHLTWLPQAGLMAAVIALKIFDIPGSYESPHLQMALNFVTRTLACLLIACLVGRRFLIQGAPGFLLLGCGALIWGTAGFIGTGITSKDANLSVTITNIGAWLSSLCYLLSTILPLKSKQRIRRPGWWLPAARGSKLPGLPPGC